MSVGNSIDDLMQGFAEAFRPLLPESIAVRQFRERGGRDWRDVEALAALNTPRAMKELRQALRCGDHAIAMAVLEYAPSVVTDEERTAALVSALGEAEIGSGLAEALRLVNHFHPPEVIDALFLAVLTRPNAVLFVATLMYLCGQATSDFDYELRPFYFQFQGGDRESHSANSVKWLGWTRGSIFILDDRAAGPDFFSSLCRFPPLSFDASM